RARGRPHLCDRGRASGRGRVPRRTAGPGRPLRPSGAAAVAGRRPGGGERGVRPLRIPWVQASLAWVLASWMRLCFVTMRWSRENEAAAQAVWDQGGGVLCVFWHSKLSLAPGAWPLDRAQPVKGLISLSADGEFLA